jgi:hypothetical protein
MRRYQRFVSALAAVLAWHSPASAAPPGSEEEMAEAGREEPRGPAAATWFLIDARNHVRGTSGLVAVVFGVAEERGHSRQAVLRVDCFDGLTAVHIDTVGLGLGLSLPIVAVRYSLDGGRYVSASWQASVDGSGLELSADQAITFVTELYGKSELRLAVVRPLSVPFLFRFAIGGAEQSLRALADQCHWSEGPAISDAGR